MKTAFFVSVAVGKTTRTTLFCELALVGAGRSLRNPLSVSAASIS
jgi:hypothetical protein